MTAESAKTKKFIYRQGIASQKLEGLELTYSNHKLALAYQSGKISRSELIEKAAAHARTQ